MNKRKALFTSLLGGIIWALIWTIGMNIWGRPLNYSGILGGITYCVGVISSYLVVNETYKSLSS